MTDSPSIATESANKTTAHATGQEATPPVRWRGKKADQQRSLFTGLWLPATLLLTMSAGFGTVFGILSFVSDRPQTQLIPIWASRVSSITTGIHGPIENDRMALAKTNLFSRVAMPDTKNWGRQHFLDAVRIAHATPTEDALVVYVSAFATMDSAGELFLIPGSSNPSNAQERIYLEQLLSELKTSPSSEKLLVLDINWPLALPNLEMHSSDVATQIQKTIDANEDPNLLCISSCSAGQLSWTMTSPKRSVFGYFFEQGIFGAADGSNQEIADGRVSVNELAAYLTSTVDEYSVAACPARQTPVLMGSGRNFDLVACSHHAATSAVVKSESPNTTTNDSADAGFPPWLAAAWNYRDQIASANVWQVRPQFLSQCEAAILQSEMTWRRCGAMEGMAVDLDDQLKNLATEFNQQTQVYRMPSGVNDQQLLVAIPNILDASESTDKTKAIEPAKDTQNSTSTAGSKPSPESTANQTSSLTPKQGEKPANQKSLAAVASPSPHTPNPLSNLHVDHVLAQLESFLADTDEQRKISDPAKWPQMQAKRIHEFAKETNSFSDTLFSQAIVRYLVEKPNLNSDEIISLATIWRKRPGPLADISMSIFLEIADRLQDPLATNSMPWSDSQIQQFIRLITASEKPFGRIGCWSRLNRLKSLTDDKRYVVENLFWNPGYVDSRILSERSQVCISDFVSLQALAQRLELSLNTLDTSLWKLQHVFAMNQCLFKASKPWLDAIATTKQLLLHSLSPSDQVSSEHNDWATINKEVELIENQAIALQALLQQLFGNSNPDEVDAFVKDIQSCQLTTLNKRHIQDLLGTPWISFKHRLALHNALLRWQPESKLSSIASSTPTLNPRSGLTANQRQSGKNKSKRRLEDRQQVAKAIIDLSKIVTSMSSTTNRSNDPLFSCYEKEWKHRARFYQKLSQHSPLAAAYEGLAQQYRNQTEFLAVASAPVSTQATDLSLSPKNPHTKFPIALNANGEMPRGPFQNVSFSNSSRPNFKASPQLHASVIEPANSILDAKVFTNESRGQLVVDASLDASLQSERLAQVKGFFIELIEGDSIHLHRVNLPGLAQSNPVELSIAKSLDEFDSLQSQIRLRPSLQRQAMSLLVKNNTNKRAEWIVTANGNKATIQLPPYQSHAVKFSGKPPKPKDALPVISDQLRVSVHDKASGTLLCEKSFGIVVGSPREYVEVISSRFEPYPSGGNRLEVTLRSLRPITGPECTAQIVLNKQLVPGLLGIQGGQLSANIPRDGTPVTLYAENLKLAEQADEQGQFEIAVDGAPRTFVFSTVFARQGNGTTPHLIHKPLIQLEAEEVGLAGPNLPITIKTTNLPTDANMQLALQRFGGSQSPDQQFSLASPFETRVGLATSQNGDLLFSASIRDWQKKLDTSGLVGVRQWVCEAMLGEQVIVRRTRSVSLDDRPPRSVRFKDLPQRAATSSSQPVSISALSDLTSIRSVQLFTGEPENGQIPKTAKPIQCRRNIAAKGAWTALFQLPKKPGLIKITAAATNGAGLTTFETAALDVVLPETLNVGSIAGQVFESVRSQPGLDVVLKNASGKIVAKTKSLFDGRFRFTAIPAGNYLVESTKPASGRRGAIRVVVKPGQTCSGDISLEL